MTLRGIQERWDAEKEGGMQEMRDVGKEGYRRGGIAGQNRKGGSRKEGMQDMGGGGRVTSVKGGGTPHRPSLPGSASGEYAFS